MIDISATMPRPKIPVFRTAYDAYRLGIGAIFSNGRMFRFFVYGSLLIIGLFGAVLYANLTVTQSIMGASAGEDMTLVVIGTFLLGAATYTLIAAAQTPLGLFVQRRILLGDTPQRSYFGYITSSPGDRFFVASVAIYAIFYVAGLIHAPIVYLIYGVNPLDQRALSALMATRPAASMAMTSIWFTAFITAALISAKCAFAFPIVASDRPGPALRQSFAETRGTMWRLFFLFVLVFIPPFLAYLIFTLVVAVSLAPKGIVGESLTAGSFGGSWQLVYVLLSPQIIVAGIVLLIAFMLSHVAMAAAAARAYNIRIDRGLSAVAEVFS